MEKYVSRFEERNFDGTGPSGAGPLTGRMLGVCNSEDNNEEEELDQDFGSIYADDTLIDDSVGEYVGNDIYGDPEYDDDDEDAFASVYEEYKKEAKLSEADTDDKKTKEAIKAIIKTNWGGDNKEQGKAAELIKGLSFSDSSIANAFMKDLNKVTDAMDLSKYGV